MVTMLGSAIDAFFRYLSVKERMLCFIESRTRKHQSRCSQVISFGNAMIVYRSCKIKSQTCVIQTFLSYAFFWFISTLGLDGCLLGCSEFI